MKSWEPEGQESLGKDGKGPWIEQSCTQMGRAGCSAHAWLCWHTEKLKRAQRMSPELNGGLRDEYRPAGSPGRVTPSWFLLAVFHLWFSQSIPHGWHRAGSVLPWQVSAENTHFIISTNNSGQAKPSLGPDLLL